MGKIQINLERRFQSRDDFPELRQVIRERLNPEQVTIKEVMRTKVPMVAPDESSEKCIELMKQHKCRHLLVFDMDAFVGIISLRDLLVLLLEEKEELIRVRLRRNRAAQSKTTPAPAAI